MPVTIYPPYACPSCGVRLVANFPRWGGWARCPRCGSPGLPSARVRIFPIASVPAAPVELMVPEDFGQSAGPLPPRPASRSARARIHHPPRALGTTQWIASTGLFVSAFLLLVSYLDRKGASMAVFGTLAVAFCILLIVVRWLSRRALKGDVGDA